MPGFPGDEGHPRGAGAPSVHRPVLVLDTNTALDLWAFSDPRVQGLREALEAARVDCPATPAMRQELQAVLERGVGARHGATVDGVLGPWDRSVRLVADASPGAAAARLRCRDPDDQKFIDLALATGAQALLSADRDLLSLARRAGMLGLEIRPPYGWPLRSVARGTDQG